MGYVKKETILPGSGFVFPFLLATGLALGTLGWWGLKRISDEWEPLLRPRILEQQKNSSVRIIAHDFDGSAKWLGSITHGRLKEKNYLPLSEIPALQIQAIVRLEDPRFLEHGGFDFKGILRAAWINLKHMHFAQGGSTITQQLVKNIFLSKERTLSRKFIELVLAVMLEQEFTKDEILEAYLNEVYLGQIGGAQIHGVGRAAEFYFGKKMSDLAVHEQALIAALVAGPGFYSPWKHPDRALTRRNTVLKKLREAELLLESEYAEAITKNLPEKSQLLSTTKAAYAVEAIQEELAQEKSESELINGAFDYVVSLDLKMQALAEESLLKNAAAWGPEVEGLIVGVDPRDCSVKIYAGGTDYRKTQYDRIRFSRRQMGSLVKPLLSAPLLENQDEISLATPLQDKELVWNYPGAPKAWRPENYDKKNRGVVTLRQTLEESLNVPFVELFYSRFKDEKLEFVFDPLRSFGLVLDPARTPPSALLGSLDQRPLDIIGAYAKLARQALGFAPDAADFECKIHFEKRTIEAEREPLDEPFQQSGARLALAALEGAFRRGTGSSLGKKIPLEQNWATKTGTSSDKKDSWFVALSPELVLLSWVGRDDSKATQFTGATGALLLVEPLMKNSNISSEFSWPISNKMIWHEINLKNHCRMEHENNSPMASTFIEKRPTTPPPPQYSEDGITRVWEIFRKGSEVPVCDN